MDHRGGEYEQGHQSLRGRQRNNVSEPDCGHCSHHEVEWNQERVVGPIVAEIEAAWLIGELFHDRYSDGEEVAESEGEEDKAKYLISDVYYSHLVLEDCRGQWECLQFSVHSLVSFFLLPGVCGSVTLLC